VTMEWIIEWEKRPIAAATQKADFGVRKTVLC
jgi:hypothetical protein